VERIVRFEAGYDCMTFECKFKSDRCIPNQGGSHGKHGITIRFVVKGEAGAIQFCIYTGWMPQHAKVSLGSRYVSDWSDGCKVMPADIGYHSKKPMYEGQTSVTESCEFCDGEPCYYDGSSLNAQNPMYTLVNRGGEALWEYLEQYYRATFEGGEYPEEMEYPMPVRKAGHGSLLI